MSSDKKFVAPSLPKGGGAISGIGETFQPNLFTGTGNFSIPITASPGRDNFGPKLSLQYSSGNGNGPFGFGWQLSIPRITRKTEKGLPKYDETDVFIMSGAEDLVPVLDKDSQGNWILLANGDYKIHEEDRTVGGVRYIVRGYRPRTEGPFARIERWEAIDSDGRNVHWRAITRDNVSSIYGRSPNTRLTHPHNDAKIFEWLLEETFDEKGNHILYEYARDDPRLGDREHPELQINQIYEQNRAYGQLYIRRIYYGNISRSTQIVYSDGSSVGAQPQGTYPMRYVFEIVFDYGDLQNDYQRAAVGQELFTNESPPLREDPFSSFRSGFEIRTLRRCERVLMFHHFKELGGSTLVKSTDFHYDPNPDTTISFLTSATVTGYLSNAGHNGYTSASMPPVTFTYSAFKPHEQHYQSLQARGNDLPPLALKRPDVTLIDLFGDGLPDVLHTSANGFRFWKNLGDGLLDRPQVLRTIPAGLTLSQPGVGFGDMDGDGRLELLIHNGPLQGFFEATPDGAWQNFRAYVSTPSFDLADPNVRMLDLTGDGRSDVLMTRDHHFLWFECLGNEGFGEPQFVERVRDLNLFPDVYFNDPSGRVRLADMTGDGLQDIVLLHNGQVDYWPNVGYGNFGHRITMGELHDAPMLEYAFDPQRLFLVDLDGSGCADLVYVDFDCVHFWFNRSGNSWSKRQTIHGTPHISDVDSLQFADIFGTGTTTLVWSYDYGAVNGGNYKALDFCGGVKPYVLIEMNNNMGATTRVRYAASTQYAREDAEHGKPWATQLPFPVQVLQKVESIDHIGRTKLVKTYSYHHGFYDGREREFRGFGRVDEFDTEEFEIFSQADLHAAENSFDNGQKQYHVPPILTKSWFHTGAYFEDRILAECFGREYFAGDPAHLHPGDNKVEAGNTPHAAYRALRGSIMRSEVFAMDGSAKQVNPYLIIENTYRVKELQPSAAKAPGVYLTTPEETLTFHYERNPTDPRVSHNLTLEVDAFGNVLKSASIGYGRRSPNPELPSQADRDKQTQTFIIYTENDYTKPILEDDAYHSPLPCEIRMYELTGYLPDGAEGRFQNSDFVQPDPAHPDRLAHIFDGEIQYEQQPSNGRERRLIEHIRTLYRSNRLDILLPLGVLESLALPGENYKQAFTPGLASQIFVDSGKLTAAELNNILSDEAKYVPSAGDQNWWIPSDRIFFEPNADVNHPANSAAQELADAINHFFLPRKATDPFNQSATVEYDDYDLFVTKTQDAVGNTITAQHDYRVLQSKLISDSNGNRSTAAFDILGLVAGTALMGKPLPSPVEGDSLEDFDPDLTLPKIEGFFDAANPHLLASELLKGATTRIIYDLDRFRRSQQAYPTTPEKWLPVCAATLTRETHLSDPPPLEGVKIQISFSYSDGFGREIQKKIQAEQGPIPKRDAAGRIIIGADGQPEMIANDVNPRWVGSGWIIFNNKGKPVRQYEPFFSDLHAFEFNVQIGVSPLLFYDPIGRVIATLHPNHTYEKVIFDPWRQISYDVNDTVKLDPRTDADISSYVMEYFEQAAPHPGDWKTWLQQRGVDPLAPPPDIPGLAPDKKAAVRTLPHADTPAVAHFDALGRPFLTIADNGPSGKYETRVELDIENNQRRVTDALGHTVMTYDYSMLSEKVHQNSMDAGQRWMLNDVTGKPLHVWDSRSAEFIFHYDELRRPTAMRVKGGDGPTSLDHVYEWIIYGENKALTGKTDAEIDLLNLRGKPFAHYDTGGKLLFERYDFKGNLLASRRRLAEDYKNIPNWDSAYPDDLLQDESYLAEMEYDALNRVTKSRTPDGSLTSPAYNAANLLEKVTVLLPDGASNNFVTDINYNEKGHRKEIKYGNDITTKYGYEKETFRLSRLETRQANGKLLQDLSYTYDPAGNIIQIEDRARPTIFFNNFMTEPVNSFRYDATYRLAQAEGREHIAQVGYDALDNWKDAPFMKQYSVNDPLAWRPYTQTYQYDQVGNIRQMQHSAPGGTWTRDYNYETSNNRLKSTVVGDPLTYTYAYSHHPQHGFMTAMPHLESMAWNFKDELQAVVQQHTMNGNAPETTYYVYDFSGQRIRKVTERAALAGAAPTLKSERIYVGGIEVYKEYPGNGTHHGLERKTLHVMDDKSRIALVETRNAVDDGSPAKLIRYQFSNHLGTACLETNETGRVISYEEYHPYGTTSYQAVDKDIKALAKRYRYSGKERDEESGLYYYGARYYAPWLGRWTSSDPAEMVDGTNTYAYVRASPIMLIDDQGLATGVSETPEELQSLQSLPEGGEQGQSFYFPDQQVIDGDGMIMTQKEYDNKAQGALKQTMMDAYHSAGDTVACGPQIWLSGFASKVTDNPSSIKGIVTTGTMLWQVKSTAAGVAGARTHNTALSSTSPAPTSNLVGGPTDGATARPDKTSISLPVVTSGLSRPTPEMQFRNEIMNARDFINYATQINPRDAVGITRLRSGTSLTPQTGGIKSHTQYEQINERLNTRFAGSGFRVRTEVFKSVVTGADASRRAAGSKGVDLVLEYQREPILNVDLKTGRLWSPQSLAVYERVFGPVVQVQIPYRR